jgi:N-acetylglucosaminyldiphosphoundecaprenol N-acetyl-beta-D-mannosaminyltransferase
MGTDPTSLSAVFGGGAMAMENETTQVAPRVDVLGVGVSCVDLDETVGIFESWIGSREAHYVCVTGMHGVMESRADPILRDIHNKSGLTTPDGMPLVWAGRRAGARISRVYGPDLMEAVFAKAEDAGWSNFFFGGRPEVADRLMVTLRERFPRLVIAGALSPPFRDPSELEESRMVDQINRAAPDIVWVCLGTPKQEHWMAGHRRALHAPVLVGVGAAFDLLAGTLPQAPKWMQRSGLEWAFRLAAEPRRLWRRYLLNIPRFLAALAARPPRMLSPSNAGPEYGQEATAPTRSS